MSLYDYRIDLCYTKNLTESLGLKLEFSQNKDKNRGSLFVETSGHKRLQLLSYIKTKNGAGGTVYLRGYLCQSSKHDKLLEEYSPSWYEYMHKAFFSDLTNMPKKQDALKMHLVEQKMVDELIKAYARKVRSEESIDIAEPETVKATIALKKKKKRPEPRVIKMVKQLNNYTCDCCGVNVAKAAETSIQIEEMKDELIQVHHKDGNPENNNIGNLTTLCTTCHGNQPGHGHQFQRNRKSHHFILGQIRKDQGLSSRAYEAI
jgi:hypothetical protein